MRSVSLLSTFLLAAACGAAPRPTPVTVSQPVVPLATVDTRPAKVDAPRDLVAWMHVEHPAKLAALIEQAVGPADKDATCPKGNVRACLEYADPSHPVDAAVALSDSGDDATAVAFSVTSLRAFRTRAAVDFDVRELRPGRLGLEAAKAKDKLECDVTRADMPDHRVVCGEPRGVERLGAWLASSPAPASRDGLARIDIRRAPFVALADKAWPADDQAHEDVRALAHDFDGATITLDAGDDPSSTAALALDVRMRDSKSSWTRMVFSPASSSPMPATFARLVPDSTGVIYVPGGPQLAEIFDRLGAFKELAPGDPAKTKPVLDELRAEFAKPMACGYVVDLDDGRAALANVKRAAPKDLDKAHAELDAALSGHATCALQETTKAVERLMRKVVPLYPANGDHYVFRSATSLGLPAASFVFETTHAPKPGVKKSAPPAKDTMLAVPDGDTTWVIFANNGNDVARTTRAIKRVLSRPAGATDAFAAPPGTLLTGFATTFLGAFFWDLAMHSYDEVEKTLATTTSARMQLSLSQAPAGSGGTLSLHLAAPVSSLPTFGKRASAVAVPIGIFAALMFADASSKPSATP